MKLQTAINGAIKSYNAFLKYSSVIDEYCLERWGTHPSDIDCDEIIDRVFGGAGMMKEMKAEEFIRLMDEAMERDNQS